MTDEITTNIITDIELNPEQYEKVLNLILKLKKEDKKNGDNKSRKSR